MSASGQSHSIYRNTGSSSSSTVGAWVEFVALHLAFATELTTELAAGDGLALSLGQRPDRWTAMLHHWDNSK